MAQPRFLFGTRTTADENHAETQADIPELSTHRGRPTGERQMAWRLVGANNRELGRSVDLYDDLAACRDAVTWLRGGIRRAHPYTAVSHVTGQWSWRLEIDGETVAVSGREYRRQRECHYNLTNFLAAVPIARVPVPPQARDENSAGRSRLHDVFHTSQARAPRPRRGGASMTFVVAAEVVRL